MLDQHVREGKAPTGWRDRKGYFPREGSTSSTDNTMGEVERHLPTTAARHQIITAQYGWLWNRENTTLW